MCTYPQRVLVNAANLAFSNGIAMWKKRKQPSLDTLQDIFIVSSQTTLEILQNVSQIL